MRFSKLVKFSLAGLFAFGFTALNAKPLEEAIRNVDVSGFAWYRYDNGRFTSGSSQNLDGGGIPWTQMHRFRVALGTKLDIGDNFKVFGQVLYNINDETSYAYGDYTGGASTKQPFWLKQAYLEYDNRDYGVNLILGRQNLNTIWTDDLAGMAAKFILRPNDQVTFAVFAVDSFQDGDDRGDFSVYDSYFSRLNSSANGVGSALTTRLTAYNLYGAAFLGDYGALKTQIWLGHLEKTATFYAFNLDIGIPFGDFNTHIFRIHANYMGNVIDDNLQDDAKIALAGTTTGAAAMAAAYKNLFANGNLAHLKLILQAGGFDANAGAIYFGEKNKFTIHTLEEAYGGDEEMYIGSEILYQKGSWGNAAYGRNAFGYLGVGYMLPADVHLGVRGVYGRTANDTGTVSAENGGGRKVEGIAQIDWKATRGLDFRLYYSYLHTQEDKGVSVDEDAVSVKNTVRFQARYSF